MLFSSQHPWDVSVAEAIAIQQQLRHSVVSCVDVGSVTCVAGVDVGFDRQAKVARAAVVRLSFPGLELLETALARQPVTFPYVPGLLSFREVPVILAALVKLSKRPDLLLCDGHGMAHPRRFGLACHLGVLCDIPSIGAAKSLLIGTYTPPGDRRGDWQPLLAGDETIGAVVRTRSGARPVFVSIGHRVDLAAAVDYVLACTPHYRLPETTRLAHSLASNVG